MSLLLLTQPIGVCFKVRPIVVEVLKFVILFQDKIFSPPSYLCFQESFSIKLVVRFHEIFQNL